MRSVSTKSLAIMAVLAICATGCFGMALVSDDADADGTYSFVVGKYYSSQGIFARPGDASLLSVSGTVPGMSIYPIQNGVMGLVIANGTPTTAGTYTVKVYDSGTLMSTVTIVVSSSSTPVNVAWTVGQAVNADIDGFPGDASSVTIDGSVPGITLTKRQNQQATIISANGTPTTAGTFKVTLKIGTAERVITATVVLPPTSADQYVDIAAEVGKALSYGHPWMEYQSGSIPGCTIENPVSGGMLIFKISGTPTTAGTYTIVGKTTVDFDTPTERILSGTTYYLRVNVANNSFNHSVHYDANGGTGAPADTVVTDSVNGNSTVTLSSSTPTRSGYTFDGWYTASSGGSKVTSVSVGANAITTVYAHWIENTLTIGSVAKQYAVAGGSVSFAGSCVSTPSGASVGYSATNVQSGLTVNVSGNTVTCTANSVGTYTFTLNASASNYAGSSTTVTVQFVPVLAFSNTPSAGALNA